MSLTLFLAICILGCDVLIYFLYEWAFGESKRIRRRRTASRLWANSHGAQSRLAPAEPKREAAHVVETPHRRKPAVVVPIRNAQDERLAYRRLAASFGQLKTRG